VPIFVGTLTVVTGAYMAAVFLAADAVRAGLPDLVRAFRNRALGAGVVAGVLAIAGLFVVREEAPALHDGLTSGGGLAMVIASAIAGVITLALVWRERFELARFTSAAAVAAVVGGWALSQRPDILPGELSLRDAAASDATLGALLIAVAIAVVVLVPSLGLLFRLTLQGRLDQEFHPIVAADPEGERDE
jgi:cytochrome d ubiquinol oxidase subunit II